MPVVPATIKVAVLSYANTNRFSRHGLPVFRLVLGASFAILLMGGGTVAVSQAAAPGHLLYPVKLASEKAYSLAQVTSTGKTQAADAVLHRRTDEADIVNDADDNETMTNAFAEALADSSDEWVNAQDNLFSLAISNDR